MRWRARRVAAMAVAAACVLSFAACSQDDDSGGSAAENGTKASGDAIKIGLFNPSLGAVPQPGVTVGKNAAVDYINNQIGGINGRPIEIVDCGIDQASPESTSACATQFQEQGVVAAIDAYNTQSAAALKTLTAAGIPLVGQIPFNLTTGAQTANRVYFGPPPAAFLVGFMQQLKAAGKTSLKLANADLPEAHVVFDQLLKPMGALLGIKVDAIYYPATGPNFTQLASTLADGNPAATGLMTSPMDSTCTKLAESLRSINYKGTIFLAACTDFISELGDQAVGAQTYSPIWQPPSADSAPEPAKTNLATAQKFIDNQEGNAGFYGYGTFSILADFANILNAAKVTDITGPVVLTALKAVKDYQSFLGPKLANCGKATSPNCTTEMLLFDVVANNKTQPVTGGFITPLPAALAKIPGAA
ncbi:MULTISPECIES: ABC transporter substrate-binding protein [unclassified Gordonia (in: high G+C Gram-positive bacteria)]|uniref:ABC transporter substrate-binding protein n=1 Tax=unclassified Gordonia (in: high G+C Gram-positive bacteria) TaxID=2657482 RepID=UPI001F0F8193|nr:ABC transporter substrate-binding protein [Gordonia sp. ABSL49_1]MCH5644587.1 ABC transporter substrate-binding protein [Gordonia sp. ABSL49_1]